MKAEEPVTRRGARAETGYLWVLVTVLGWGLNWPLMKILLRDWPPLLGRATSSTAAAAGLALLAVATRASLRVAGADWGRLAWSSFASVTVWMGASTLSLRWLSVAEAALLVYTLPIWAMLFSWPLRGERPSARGLAGLALGFCGLLVLFSGKGLTLGSGKLPGIVFALSAAVIFAFGTVTSRPTRLAPLAHVAWQVGLGALPMWLGTLLFEQGQAGSLTAEGFGALAYMTLVPMGVCYLCWFAALERLTPSAAASAMLLVPIVGIGSAALVIGEALGLREMAALVLVLSGVLLSVRRDRTS